jgi:hypothetical protein
MNPLDGEVRKNGTRKMNIEFQVIPRCYLDQRQPHSGVKERAVKYRREEKQPPHPLQDASKPPALGFGWGVRLLFFRHWDVRYQSNRLLQSVGMLAGANISI